MKNKKGITLIALVITIIVLLILAGVSISMISSQDGILNKATGAKEKMNNAEEVEQIQLAVMASYNEEGQIDCGKLKTELNKIKEITPITEEISLPIIVEINGYKIQIRSNGTVRGEQEIKKLNVTLNATYEGIRIKDGNRICTILAKASADSDSTDITYKYYIKYASDSDNKYELKYTGPESEYYYDGLGEWSSYMLKVEVIDMNGDIGKTEITAGTECFVAGTQVLTENGMENIENIEVGQKVYALNIDTNERELKKITRVFKGKSDEIYKLKVGEETIEVTPKHQFYIVDKGWVRAYDLKEGDKIVSKETKDMIIEKIEHKKLEEPVKVYNLTVEGYHNYLITKYRLLVHNAPSII